MSEEIKAIRLSKISKEFNVGVATIVEFLAKKGHEIDSNPNTKIDGNLYDLLASEFQAERKVKEQADKITLVAPIAVVEAKQTEAIETVPQKEDPKSTAAAITVKKTATKKKTEDPKVKETVEAVAVATESPKEKEVVVPVKTTKAKKTDAKSTVAEKPAEAVTIPSLSEEEVITPIKSPTPSVEKVADTTEPSDEPNAQDMPVMPKSNSKTDIAGPKIIGKIDIADLNTKTRPEKKTKAEKEQARKEQAIKPKSSKPADTTAELPTNNIVESTPAPPIEKPVEIELPMEEQTQATVETVTTTPVEPQKEENFLETKYIKLEGPRIVEGQKVDLSQFDRVKKTTSPAKDNALDDSRKKKRKRIGKESVDIPAQQQPNQPHQQTSFKDKKDAFKAKKNKKGKEPAKPIIDGQEIEKQIKETLARLAPMGKSKTSKHRREKRQNVSQLLQEELAIDAQNKKNIRITEFVTANELATMMDVSVNKVIAACMSLGMLVSINQRLDAEAIQLIADEFGYTIEFVSADVVEALEEENVKDLPENLVSRAPIVTVMGHVDHGKTSLLDYIRNANVIAGEAGGITQHIGAYEVKLANGKKIAFLDTPGHEAFTAMRARGAKVTDITIIVIACDDRVMPQTVEAINHAQAAGCPIIFALNKIDKAGANPDKIREELANMNLLVEEWGGKYQSQEISAKKGLNVDALLEKVLLEADLLELKGNPDKRAKGTIIESSLDKGRGYIAKILVQDGTLKQGDFVLAGTTFGRVKAMHNERNQILDSAGPSTPLLLLGLNGAPQAGDLFNVMPSEKEAKDLANRRTQLQREQGLRTQKHITLTEIGRRIAIGDFKQLNIIVKGDVDGSVEALSDSLLKLSTEQVEVNVIHRSVGQITESDVLLATASNAIIIGFQVRPSASARKLAETEQIDIRLYSIIYTAINEIKDAIEGMLSPEIEEKILANLEIRETFKIGKVGTIAGCICLEGKMNRSSKVRLIRDGIVVYTGKLASLRRFKDDVKEVVSGQDCGLNIENFNDIKVGDIIEAYEEIEIKRKL